MLAPEIKYVAQQVGEAADQATAEAEIYVLPVAEEARVPEDTASFPAYLNASLLDTYTAAGKTRPHRLYGATIEDTYHVFLVTEPEDEQPPSLTVLSKPGLGEMIESGVGLQFHIELADRLPDARVVSLATNGFGPAAQRPSVKELPAFNMEHQAATCRQFIDVLPQDSRRVFIGVSMGSVILNRLLVDAINKGNPLDVGLLVYLNPALVTPDHVFRDMVIRFPSHFTADLLRELPRRESPRQLFKYVQTLIDSLPGPKDALLAGRLALSLTDGTPLEDIRLVAETYPTVPVHGTLDSVGQSKMWQALETECSGTLKPCSLRRRGHALAANAIGSATKAAKTIVAANITSL